MIRPHRPAPPPRWRGYTATDCTAIGVTAGLLALAAPVAALPGLPTAFVCVAAGAFGVAITLWRRGQSTPDPSPSNGALPR